MVRVWQSSKKIEKKNDTKLYVNKKESEVLQN